MSSVQAAGTAVAPGADEFAGALPERVDPAVIRKLSELKPLVSALHIALGWALIAGAAFVCSRWFHPLLYAVCVAFIGARQHGLIVLAHDAAHYRLFRNRALNDWTGELLLAWPFVLFTMQAYRRNHFPHHRHINTDDDPDWVRKRTPEWEFPKRRTELARMLLADATGIGFVKFIGVASKLPRAPKSAESSRDRIFRVGRLVFLASLGTALTLLGGWKAYLLYWVVPYVTWMQLAFHVRSIAEHFAITGRSGVYAGTRTVLPNWFDRAFIGTNNVNYHLEHHLYPSVPFYNLPELHRVLMQDPEYRRSAHVSSGYLGVLRECAQGA
jgi:fatty acid desaturase